MNINIDAIIFFAFLIINLFVGLYSAKGIKNIKEYAIGDGKFSTIVIASTIIATWVGGSDFIIVLSEIYDNGLYFIWAFIGDGIMLFIYGYFFAPRMGEFLGKLSIADAMGGLYGERVRVITAVVACLGSSGFIAAQLKVAGLLMEYGFGIPGYYGIIVAGTIIGIYSSLGGVKSVTFTDVIQLLTFGTIIPTLAFIIFSNLSNNSVILDTIKASELFNYKEVFDFTNKKSLSFLLLFLYIAIPGFNPAFFQRISMSRDVLQVRKAFLVASLFWLFIAAMISFIGVLILSDNPNLKSKDLLSYLLSNYSYVGLRGLILAGIMAMVMSTADSFINSTSVLIVNDFFKPLKIRFSENKLFLAKISSLIITILSIFLAMTGGDNLLRLVMSTQSFYMPMVSVTFVMAILGFRTTEKAVLISMLSALISIITLKILKTDDIFVFFISMSIGIVTLMASHYLLQQPGGWVGIKDYSFINTLRQNRRDTIKKIFLNISNFSFYSLFKQNTIFDQSIYVALSVFSMLTTYCLIFTLPQDISHQYSELISVVYPSMLFTASFLMSCPLWPKFFKKSVTIDVILNITIFYMLICAPFLFVLISDFASIQLSVFMINLIIISILIRWQLAMMIILSGIIITFTIVKFYLGIADIVESLGVMHFKMSFLLLIISGALIAFLKPKQEYHQLVEQQVQERTKELKEALNIKREFLDNVSHEIKTPVHNIANITNELCDQWYELTDEKKKQLAHLLKTCNEKLFSLCSNLLDLSKLGKGENFVEITACRVVNLMEEIASEYSQISNKLSVKNSVDSIIYCDFNKILQVLKNLIDNAIKYGKGSHILVSATTYDKNHIIFSVSDQGTGIDAAEINKIFEPFEQGTRKKAGSTGLGLSLCKKIILIHSGAIWVENNQFGGATFCFTLPVESKTT